MTLSQDNLLSIQYNTGSFTGSSGSVTLPAGTQAGSTIIIAAGLGLPVGGSTTIGLNTPSGFVRAVGHDGQYARPYVFVKTVASAGETSWTLNISNASSQPVVWAVFEGFGFDIDAADPSTGVYQTTVLAGQSEGSPIASRTTFDPDPDNESYDVLAVAVHFATATTTSVPTLSAAGSGWVDIASQTLVGATNAYHLVVAARPTLTLEDLTSTSNVSPNSYLHAGIFTLTGLGARYLPKLHTCFGASVGTATNLTVSSTPTGGGQGPAPWDVQVGSPAIVTSTPRTGSYCLELSSSSAAECLSWESLSFPNYGTLNLYETGSTAPWIERFHFYFPTSLPGADVELASVECQSLTNGMTIWYRAASQKIGVKVGTGTEQLSDATVAANTWIGLDYRFDARTTTFKCDWQLDYDSLDATGPVAQTQASNTGMTVGSIDKVRKGWTVARTATVRFDDIAASQQYGAYPLGDVRIVTLSVDPAGTPTISGSSANFRVFTSNGGTLTTWSAAGTRNALDDVPPTIGASADGLTQISTAASDYCEVPMETYTAAPDFAVRGLRWYWAGWAASSTGATFGFRSWDGVSEIAQHSAVDHNFDSSSLVWMTRMQRPSLGKYVLTQAKVDALAARFGFSTDAAPDVGVHCVFGELVVAPATVYGIVEAETGFNVYVRQDPVSASVISLLATTPSGTRGGTLTWTVGGVDGSQYVGPNTTYEKSIGASSIDEVTSVGFTVDPS